MTPIKFIIEAKSRYDWIVIEAANFEEDGITPISWAVRRNDTVMNKKGSFEYEPSPSSRGEEFLKEHRFDTIQDAEETYLKHHKK